MKRKQRTEILIEGSHELAKSLAKEIEQKYSVSVIQEPENGLVMLKVRETSRKSLFYLGEVLVTECKAKVEGKIGIGIVKGDHPDLAYHLAVIDAAFLGDLPETKPWTGIFEIEKYYIEQKRKAKNEAILRTKVSFETMDV
ncbi:MULTISPECIES: phosphonate C-P lyase system protein PhnG [Cytobacillus]|uniref:Phosphonate C-P lyase system protein PhnG n=1 Tax=Cytobacillus oceanisediminis 2691 TaxID=1196031 RepID=A0A169FSD0_9BACI|nr:MULTISPECIES: phosphonate C-P lyase system protein PhnG [Cytobacillus]EFV76682.1 phosphonate C-P lyase system protein PhnG [Bacillus sp. 2_A_57_CT2]MCS0824013.1 phosphonate C-P lyase system protein PhnG [Cytobacillus firmus]AND40721.1 phosphonate C-P lyase system protein PhnG [Cytobacillus oceanisediminis 2691]MBU8729642.1 phosphonate C-P lyase system protein PhnG [Cytobacillus oceanisediminis]MCM3243259.1 phosphonate C-P lyase system protein PhnG [Cytobacillus oceanisediminis]